MARQPRHKQTASDAGFLMSETLATFAISAFVLVALASIAPVLTRAIDRGVGNIQDIETLSRTLDALRRDVSGLTRARWYGEEPQPFVFRGGPNSLYFAHREEDGAGRVTMDVVALREILTDRGTRLVRAEARLPATATSFDDLHFGDQRVLETGSARLRFWYAPPRKNGEEPSRARVWPIGPRLPDAVIIEAVDATSANLLVTQRAPILANADIGCLLGAQTAQPAAAPVDPANPSQASGSTLNATAWLAGAANTQPPSNDNNAPPAAGPASPVSIVFCGRDDLKKPAGAPIPPPEAKPL